MGSPILKGFEILKLDIVFTVAVNNSRVEG